MQAIMQRDTIALMALMIVGCAGAIQSPLEKHGECVDFELDVVKDFSESISGAIESGPIDIGVKLGRSYSLKVKTQMDHITRDWVMTRQALCTSLNRGDITPSVYQQSVLCHDQALNQTRLITELVKSAHEQVALRAVEGLTEINAGVQECFESARQIAIAQQQATPAGGKAAVRLAMGDDGALAAAQAAVSQADNDWARAGALIVKAKIEWGREKYPAARTDFEAARGLFKATQDRLGQGDALVGLAKVGLGVFAQAQDRDRLTEALGHLSSANDLYAEVLGDDLEQSPRAGDWHNTAGRVHGALKDYAQAKQEYRAAQKAYRKAFGAGAHPRAVAVLNNLGVLAGKEGQTDAEIELYRQAVDAYVELYGAGHPATIKAQANLAEALFARANFLIESKQIKDACAAIKEAADLFKDAGDAYAKRAQQAHAALEICE